jgi:hypothetical protein
VDAPEMADLAAEFAQLASAVHGDGDNASALQRVAELTVKYVDGCSWASITEIHNGVGRSLCTSDSVAAQVDAIQHALGEGPCMQSAAEDNNYLLFDVIDEPRWPNFAAQAAAETSVRCVLAIRLLGGESAALNLYGAEPDAFNDEAVSDASILAANATGLVLLTAVEDERQHLELALQSNRQIGMAMGVLMAHHKITEQQAFNLLRAASQRLHRKLRDVAFEITETGELPDLRPADAGGSGAAAVPSTRAAGSDDLADVSAPMNPA